MKIVDVKQKLVTFDMEELDDFHTINDTLLAEILDQHDKENSKDTTSNQNAIFNLL